MRTLSLALLCALGFVVFASFMALPCLMSDAGQFRSAGPQSCNEHKLFKPQADLSHLLQTLPAQETMRFLLALPVMLAATALLVLPRVEAALKLRRSARVRFGRLPFATADPPHLPAFAALRAA